MINVNTLHRHAQALQNIPPPVTGFEELDKLQRDRQAAFSNVVDEVGDLVERSNALLARVSDIAALDTEGILDARRQIESDALNVAAELLRSEPARYAVPDELKADADSRCEAIVESAAEADDDLTERNMFGPGTFKGIINL